MTREETLRRRLRKVRKFAFIDDRAGPLIGRIKEQAEPHWNKRVQQHQDNASQRLLFRTN